MKKKIFCFFSFVLCFSLLISSPAFALFGNNENEADAPAELIAFRDALFASFSGRPVSYNKDVKFKADVQNGDEKLSGAAIAQKLASKGVSLVLQGNTENGNNIFGIKAKAAGATVFSASVDFSTVGIGVYIPALDKNYYVIDASLAPEVLTHLNDPASGYEITPNTLLGLTAENVPEFIGSLLSKYTDFDSAEISATVSSPSEIAYPDASVIHITTEEELQNTSKALGDSLQNLLSFAG